MSKPNIAELKRVTVLVAYSLLWIPYIYGGQHPWVGLDCSGIWVEIARLIGLYGKSEDYSVKTLWRKYEKQRVEKPGPGCLVFYGNKNQPAPRHVTICVDEHFCISASGGGSGTKTKTLGAMVTLKRIDYWKKIWGYADPFVEAEE